MMYRNSAESFGKEGSFPVLVECRPPTTWSASQRNSYSSGSFIPCIFSWIYSSLPTRSRSTSPRDALGPEK